MTESQPQSLYKYLDADAATAALEQCTLRWSAPSAFDDPFELDALATLDFDPAVLERAASQAIAAAVFSKQAPAGLPGHPTTSVIRRWRAQRRFNNEEEVHLALRQVLPAMVERRQEDLATILGDWQAFAARVRILCLSERNNDPSLWLRHADRHRGVVFKLSCEDASTFASPQAVHYQTRRAQITTLKEQISVLLGQTRHVAQDHFQENLLAKSRADAEEREWRCMRIDSGELAPTAQAPSCQDLPFQPAELQAVYFGARLPETRREQFLALLNERYASARVMQATLSRREFAMEFQPLNGRADDQQADTSAQTSSPEPPSG